MEIAIVGSGVIGLMSALTLTDAGYKVTIIARDLPGDDSQDWASPWAGAAMFPHPDAKGQDLQTESFKYYWALAHRDPTSGVLKATEYYDDRDNDTSIWYKTLVPRYRRLKETELPAGSKLGFDFLTMTINPLRFLPWLKKELERRGVRFIRRTLETLDAARTIANCRIVVNASGLGALQLAGDEDVMPVRGQTMFVKTDIDFLKLMQGSHYTYVIPRMYSGGAIIGGVSQEGNFERKVDEGLRPDILRRVKGLLGEKGKELELGDVEKDIVAFRPSRKGGYRVEVEGDTVHAYGFGSLGYVYSFGAAEKVRELVRGLERQSRL
ncbi:nucleotide-binding domain-containing protein [Penicillium bovifimosum]|uniref:Nucleotide-binding domain-containing protein n=1 Tax=Penicillium bovifimosum TaxID=126998 RepID=A0A9W9GT53_9EURO|nr:nucleotide-binding domain-containing protein [Penicillium bovifimosum]KAJ5129418.1 nucleotide-binding domain-containing protein [Penicillium bovifimosum]